MLPDDQPTPVRARLEFVNGDDDFGLSPKPKTKPKRVDPLLGADLGGVQITKLISEGGMSKVYEARQIHPDRLVAVKIIRHGIANDKTLHRFEREAEILGRLQHPAIAKIYAVGTYESDLGDVPFFVMEYVPNAKPITTYVYEQSLSVADCLRLFVLVCEAIAHGHDRGIVHRDLKPGNILIDVHGCPRVIDFGVARTTDSELQITKLRTDTGQLVGTVSYMSPEQFGENPHDLDERVDVYSLGVVLYEMLAGCPPYSLHKKPIHEVARIICEQRPESLCLPPKASRGLRGGAANASNGAPRLTIPRGVDAIVQKCLRKDRQGRYGTAGELASDIQRFLHGEEVRALRRATTNWLRGWGKFLGVTVAKGSGA